MMQIKEIMTREPVVIGPDMVLREAAETMRDLDSGVMPVGQNDRLVGMLTDRDITIRATAAGKDPNHTRVKEVMTSDVVYCFEDDDAGEAARKMEQHQIRRLIVLNRDKRLVGILSLGDLAIHTADDGLTGEVAEAVSENLPSRKDRRKLAPPRGLPEETDDRTGGLSAPSGATPAPDALPARRRRAAAR